MERGNFEGEGASHCKAVTCAKMAEPIVMPFGVWALTGPVNHDLDDGPDSPMETGNFGGKGRRFICHLGCGLRWAKGNTSLVVFARWR